MDGHKTEENTPNNLDFSPLQSELEEMREAVEAASLLGQELEERERKIAQLTEEVEKLHASLGESQLKIEALSRDLVDRLVQF